VRPAATDIDFKGPATMAQKKAIFAAARARGLDIDDVRALTPRRSVSKLSIREAAALLDRLNAGTACERTGRRSPRRPRGVIAMPSPAQLAKIEGLRESLGWSREGLASFLSERHFDHGGSMDKILTSRDAQGVALLLLDVLARKNAAKARSESRGQPEAKPDDFESDLNAASKPA